MPAANINPVPRAGFDPDELRFGVQLIADRIANGDRWRVWPKLPLGSPWSDVPCRDSFSSAGVFAAAVACPAAGAVVNAGVFVYPAAGGAFVYEQMTSATGTRAGTTEPAWGTTLGADTADNTCVWRCRGASVITTAQNFVVDIPPGTPIRFAQENTLYYGIVVGHATNKLAIAGAPLKCNRPIQALWIGTPEMVRMLHFKIGGAYGNSVQDLLSNINNEYFRWEVAKHYLVAFAVRHKTNAGTTQPYVNVKIGGNGVSPNATGAGIQPLAASWVDNSWVCIDTSIYTLDRGDQLEVACLTVDSGSDAADLSVDIALVAE